MLNFAILFDYALSIIRDILMMIIMMMIMMIIMIMGIILKRVFAT
jgi:hypothetical protein